MDRSIAGRGRAPGPAPPRSACGAADGEAGAESPHIASPLPDLPMTARRCSRPLLHSIARTKRNLHHAVLGDAQTAWCRCASGRRGDVGRGGQHTQRTRLPDAQGKEQRDASGVGQVGGDRHDILIGGYVRIFPPPVQNLLAGLPQALCLHSTPRTLRRAPNDSYASLCSCE